MSDESKDPQKPGRKRDEAIERPYVKFGQTFEQVRRDAGYTSLQALADDLGDITNQALSKIEQGQTNPYHPRTRWNIIRLAQLLQSDFGLAWLREHFDNPRRLSVPYVEGGNAMEDED